MSRLVMRDGSPLILPVSQINKASSNPQLSVFCGAYASHLYNRWATFKDLSLRSTPYKIVVSGGVATVSCTDPHGYQAGDRPNIDVQGVFDEQIVSLPTGTSVQILDVLPEGDIAWVFASDGLLYKVDLVAKEVVFHSAACCGSYSAGHITAADEGYLWVTYGSQVHKISKSDGSIPISVNPSGTIVNVAFINDILYIAMDTGSSTLIRRYDASGNAIDASNREVHVPEGSPIFSDSRSLRAFGTNGDKLYCVMGNGPFDLIEVDSGTLEPIRTLGFTFDGTTSYDDITEILIVGSTLFAMSGGNWCTVYVVNLTTFKITTTIPFGIRNACDIQPARRMNYDSVGQRVIVTVGGVPAQTFSVSNPGYTKKSLMAYDSSFNFVKTITAWVHNGSMYAIGGESGTQPKIVKILVTSFPAAITALKGVHTVLSVGSTLTYTFATSMLNATYWIGAQEFGAPIPLLKNRRFYVNSSSNENSLAANLYDGYDDLPWNGGSSIKVRGSIAPNSPGIVSPAQMSDVSWIELVAPANAYELILVSGTGNPYLYENAPADFDKRGVLAVGTSDNTTIPVFPGERYLIYSVSSPYYFAFKVTK